MNVNSYKCCTPNTSEFNHINKLSSLLKLVGEPSRLQILCLLKHQPHCVCEIQDHFDLSHSLISHHLSDLKQADLVTDTKKGRKVFYRLTPLGHQVITTINTLI